MMNSIGGEMRQGMCSKQDMQKVGNTLVVDSVCEIAGTSATSHAVITGDFNSGYSEEGLALARRFERVFADADVVVSPSASCVGMVREHCSPELASRVFELAEFLVKRLGLEDVGAYYPHRVTYHPTCHSLRVLRVGDAPLRLLRAVRGIDLVELGDAEECCGFGGTFAVKNPDVSAAMLTDKIAHVLSTEAEVCTAGDSSCLMHIGGGLARQRAGVRTVHLAEILASTGG